jgi:hypothetical protein
MKEKKNLIYLIIIIVLVALIIGGTICLLSNKKKKGNVVEDNSKYISIFDGKKKILKSDLDITENATINISKVDSKNGIVFLEITEPDFQFETHYLLCYNKDGKKIMDLRSLNDKDNDNNRYKYNGKYEYNDGMLTFYTTLFLGESDESTGKAFNDKELSKLTKEEKKILGNYSDVVKYDYKFENGLFSLSKKEEVSKLKDNSYYKNILS